MKKILIVFTMTFFNLSITFAQPSQKTALPPAWLVGSWKFDNYTRNDGTEKDFAKEKQFKGKSVSFTEKKFSGFGSTCVQPNYSLKTFNVSEGNVPGEELRHTAWFDGKNPQDSELVLVVVSCDRLKKDFVFEKVNDHKIALVGSSMIFFYNKK